jgi:hypothetical protein
MDGTVSVEANSSNPTEPLPSTLESIYLQFTNNTFCNDNLILLPSETPDFKYEKQRKKE